MVTSDSVYRASSRLHRVNNLNPSKSGPLFHLMPHFFQHSRGTLNVSRSPTIQPNVVVIFEPLHYILLRCRSRLACQFLTPASAVFSFTFALKILGHWKQNSDTETFQTKYVGLVLKQTSDTGGKNHIRHSLPHPL